MRFKIDEFTVIPTSLLALAIGLAVSACDQPDEDSDQPLAVDVLDAEARELPVADQAEANTEEANTEEANTEEVNTEERNRWDDDDDDDGWGRRHSNRHWDDDDDDDGHRRGRHGRWD